MKNILFFHTLVLIISITFFTNHKLFAQYPKEQNSIPLSITLNEYFLEKISKDTAISRLERRNLPDTIKQFIINNLPDTTYHYLVFKDSLFFEYITFGKEVVSYQTLKLHAPVVGRDSFLIKLPIDSCLRTSLFVKDDTNKLMEDGVSKSPPFSYSKTRITLLINTDPLFRQNACNLTSDPIGCLCRLACEYVHSQLNIHFMDGICCFYL